jgi:O-succinylbenzoic acid--CoA ligase
VKRSFSNLIKFISPNNSKITHQELEIYHQKTLEFCEQWNAGQEIFYLQTSGSTGKPKTISIARKQMKASALMTQKALDLKSGYTSLVCLNTEFIAGKMMLVRGMEIGMDMYIVYPVSNPLIDLPQDLIFDFAAMVPYQIQTILEETPEKLSKLNSMKALIIGGAPISDSLKQAIQSVEAPVYSTYGMTETVSHIALRRINGFNASDTFTVLPDIEIKTDSRSCLQIKGLVTNYETITTNDVVELLNEKQFKWKGRADHIINSGGIKIQVEELELKISRIFQEFHIIKRFIIIGLEHDSFGDIVVLLIEGNLDSDLATELTFRLKSNLQKHEVPKKIIHLDFFKETPSRKIDRIMTKEMLYN